MIQKSQEIAAALSKMNGLGRILSIGDGPASLILILLPVAMPGLVAAVVLFLWIWNEFLFALVLTSGSDVAPLAIRMSQFFTRYGRDWNGILALNVVASFPLRLFFVFMQRWVIAGMTGGAVKWATAP